MSSRLISLASATAVLLASVSPSFAGGKAVECYQKYHEPAVYDTVYEKVLIRQASHRVEVTPAIYGTQKKRVVLTPQRVTYEHVPARYAYVKEKVVIHEATKVKRVIPAVTKTVTSKVKVSDGGYSWEWRVINGKKVLCKIKHKARYKTVKETIVVEHERVVYEKIPATYGYEKRKVLVSEGYKRKIVIPAEYGYVQEKVMIQPASKRYIEVPAVYQTVARKVVVSEARSGWERVALPRHCKG